jgi:hypothetical protein
MATKKKEVEQKQIKVYSKQSRTGNAARRYVHTGQNTHKKNEEDACIYLGHILSSIMFSPPRLPFTFFLLFLFLYFKVIKVKCPTRISSFKKCGHLRWCWVTGSKATQQLKNKTHTMLIALENKLIVLFCC